MPTLDSPSAWLLAMAATVGACGQSTSPPAPIPTLLGAHVYDLPGVLPDGDRRVVAALFFAEQPRCTDAEFLAYGLYIDADPTAPVPTGTSVEGLEGLGVDLRLNARCNDDGELFSPAGDVFVYRDDAEAHWVLAIAVPGRRLPPRFGWIGFAQQDDLMLRVPEPPDYAVWAPYQGEES
ncbi:MAG: hypothetical protein AAF799_25305 [Myxococcota bacterium]